MILWASSLLFPALLFMFFPLFLLLLKWTSVVLLILGRWLFFPLHFNEMPLLSPVTGPKETSEFFLLVAFTFPFLVFAFLTLHRSYGFPENP